MCISMHSNGCLLRGFCGIIEKTVPILEEPMKKVLFVATLVKNHIMEFHLPYLKQFCDHGWETAVAARNDYENPADCKIPFCHRFYDTPFQRSPLKMDNFRAFRQVRRLLREENYDLLHCHTPVGALVARLASIGCKNTRVIYTAHGFHFYKGAPLLNWLVYFTAEWLTAPLTDVLITINGEDYARAKRALRAKKIVYIPGVGIDTGKFQGRQARGAELRKELGIPAEATVLLSVGDLNRNKNHARVLEALTLPENEGYYYVVCGRGELLSAHLAYVKEHGLENRVFFLGYREDVPDFYAMADAFLFPSLREGLSVSVMEAMASGLPVLLSRIRGNTDMVTEGENGFFFDPKSSRDISRAIALLPTGEDRVAMGQRNRESARRFSLDTVAKQYKAIYFENSGESVQ